MGSVATQIFSGLYRDVQSGSSPALARPLKDLDTCPEAIPALSWCVLRVVILLEGEPVPQSEVLSALEQDFIKDPSKLCTINLSLS